jgi:hypothetical protein
MVEFIATLPERLRMALPQGQPAGRSRLAILLAAHHFHVALAYVFLALLLRAATLGYPVIHIDEQFYLLVGDRMLHGAVPFVDIWDRKPVGLFLLFAAMRMLGGDGIVQYQLVALLCTAGTSLVIYRTAREVAGPLGAFFAGVAYQGALSAVFCFGGQAPVYYNLLVALSGLGMLRIYTTPSAAKLLWRGAAIMAVLGVAIQIKYTVIFEGVAFGLALMVRARKHGWTHRQVLGAGTLWAGVALVPTLAALAYYAAIGHAAEFVQANFLSIFGRAEPFGWAASRLGKETLALLPVWLAIFLAPARIANFGQKNPDALAFLRYWAGAAVLGFLLFGTWYDHYVAPLLVPLMIVSAPALGLGRPYRWYSVIMLVMCLLAGGLATSINLSKHGSTQEVQKAADIIRTGLGGDGCLYVNEGDPILYHMTGACFATRYVFPNHLNGMVDVNSLGVDVNAEMARVMASHPRVVVVSAVPSSLPVNWNARGLMFGVLARDYQLYAQQQVGWRQLLIYRLKPDVLAADVRAKEAHQPQVADASPVRPSP